MRSSVPCISTMKSLIDVPNLLAVLEETFLYKRHTVDLGNEQPYCEQPIFSFCQDQFACSFLRVLSTEPMQTQTSPA